MGDAKEDGDFPVDLSKNVTPAKLLAATAQVQNAHDGVKWRAYREALENPFIQRENALAKGYTVDGDPATIGVAAITAKAEADGIFQAGIETASKTFLELITSPEEAAFAADTIYEERERATREAARFLALAADAQHRATAVEAMLQPSIDAYCKSHPKSTKTLWKLPGTKRKIEDAEYTAKVAVTGGKQGEQDAVLWFKAKLEFEEREKYLEIRETIKETPVRDWMVANKVTAVPGLKFTPTVRKNVIR